MSNTKAKIFADWGGGKTRNYDVKINPKEFSLEKNLQYGEINIPGLDAPLQQFVRGQAEKLSVELFFDSTENGMGKGATPVTFQTDQIYRLAKIEDSSHAPPIVTFSWGKIFPGSCLNCKNESSENENLASANQARNTFVGIVESVRQQFTLFSSEGIPLRATLTLVLKEFRTLDEQLTQLHLNSPDRTHSHPLSSGETLSSLAGLYYEDASRWRFIARKNGITDPRRLHVGNILTVPAID